MSPKKIVGLIIATFATMLALVGTGLSQATAGAPKLVIKETEHNFGEVKKTANPSYTFVFKNEGKADLEIKRVAPT